MKLRRNRKGFTLIEMMIVIAVIAILAAVIIPRSGIVQNTAKESGVESNARIVQGIVENMAPRYKASEYVTKLLPAAANKIAKAGIVNPINNVDNVLNSADGNASATAAVVYSNQAPNGGTNFEGIVYLQIYADGIYIYPYDKDGVKILEDPVQVGL
jgi:type IV pilus assembly protein PilA